MARTKKVELSCAGDIRACPSCPGLAECHLVEELLRLKQSMPKKAVAKGEVHRRNTLNELSGEEWLYFTKTLLTTNYPREYAHDLRRTHGANKPPQLMRSLIEFFTRSGELVLDPFAGVGGTLLGASICPKPRRCTGMEINPRWIDIYHQVLALHPEVLPQEMLPGDCREIMQGYPEGHFHFIATDPPYNIHLERTMCNGHYDGEFPNRHTDYFMLSENPRDLANLAGYEEYLTAMQEIFAGCFRVLLAGRYMAVIIRNAYQSGRYYFTHADLAEASIREGFVPKGEVVWYQAGSRLRPYGYPYAFVPNIAHQFILILQKPRRKV